MGHLSHNSLTGKGALLLMKQMVDCQRYPYQPDTGRRDPRGYAPLWMRLEHNYIKWAAIDSELEGLRMTWCTAESRDGWTPKDNAPMLCAHSTYWNQREGRPTPP